jgi:hypothetical protein
MGFSAGSMSGGAVDEDGAIICAPTRNVKGESGDIRLPGKRGRGVSFSVS